MKNTIKHYRLSSAIYKLGIAKWGGQIQIKMALFKSLYEP